MGWLENRDVWTSGFPLIGLGPGLGHHLVTMGAHINPRGSPVALIRPPYCMSMGLWEGCLQAISPFVKMDGPNARAIWGCLAHLPIDIGYPCNGRRSSWYPTHCSPLWLGTGTPHTLIFLSLSCTGKTTAKNEIGNNTITNKVV